jgi:hypothetical protein
MDDRKTESGSTALIARAPIKRLEDARELRLGYAGTGIFHAKNGTGALSIKLEIDATAIRSVAKGIVDQIPD